MSVRTRASKRMSYRIGELIDSAIEPFAPALAGRRRVNRRRNAMMVDRLNYFDAATTNRMRDDTYSVSDKSPDYGLVDDLETLQKQCSDLVRNNGIAKSAVEVRCTYEVGKGIVPQCKIDSREAGLDIEEAREIRKGIERAIKVFSKYGIDRRRQLSLVHFQKLALRSLATFGEVFVEIGRSSTNGPSTLSFEIIDPRRVSTPYGKEADDLCRMGVQYTKSGQIDGYHVRVDNPGDDLADVSWKYVKRYDADGPKILHVFEQVLPDQSRGFPWLAPVMNDIVDLDDYQEFEMATKQVEACFGLVVTRTDTSQSGFESAERNSTGTDSSGRRELTLEPGMVQYLDADEDVKTVDPSRPGGQYQPFIEKALRKIAAALNIPYELLAKDFFRTTYSSGRLGIQDGKHGFQSRGLTLIDQLLTPMYEIIVRDLAMYGLLPVSYAEVTGPEKHIWLAHCWKAPPMGYIDPSKEVKANIDARDANFVSHADIFAEYSDGDWEETFEQIHTEQMVLLEYEMERLKLRSELEEEYGLLPPEEPDQADDDQKNQQATK